MKKQKGLLVILIQLLCCHVVLLAQDSTQTDSVEKIEIVETLPMYPGGEAALLEFLRKHVHYPEMELNNSITGKAYVQFVINENGSVSDVQIFPGTEGKATKNMQAEAIRVVSMMPNWTPGTQDGKPVKVQYLIPIEFKLITSTFKKKRRRR